MSARPPGLLAHLAVTWALATSTAHRLLRQRLVRRALVWPGALTVGALLLTVAIAPRPEADRPLRVEASLTEPLRTELSAALAARGLSVAPASAASAASDPSPADISRDPDGDWVIADPGAAWAPAAEQALRQVDPSLPWTLRLQTEADGSPAAMALPSPGRLLAVQISLLYALYGVVLGAAATVRDRQTGVLEAQLVTGVPRWTIGLGRVLASAGVLGLALATTLLLLAGFLELPALGDWLLHGLIGTGLAVALGTWRAAASKREGLSAPLSQGLTAVTGLVVLGFGKAALGGWLPLASLGALGSGAEVPVPVVAALLTLVAFAMATRALTRPGGGA